MPTQPAPCHRGDEDPTIREWLDELRRERNEDRMERRQQSTDFGAALDRLGVVVERGFADMRTDLRRQSAVVVLALILVTALAGAGVYVKAAGIELHATPAAIAAPQAHPVEAVP